MDTVRVKEILESSDTIQVSYRGKPVWIERVQNNNTALVSQLGGASKSKEEVPVYLLTENNPV